MNQTIRSVNLKNNSFNRLRYYFINLIFSMSLALSFFNCRQSGESSFVQSHRLALDVEENAKVGVRQAQKLKTAVEQMQPYAQDFIQLDSHRARELQKNEDFQKNLDSLIQALEPYGFSANDLKVEMMTLREQVKNPENLEDREQRPWKYRMRKASPFFIFIAFPLIMGVLITLAERDHENDES